jgi:hypothetical protein
VNVLIIASCSSNLLLVRYFFAKTDQGSLVIGSTDKLFLKVAEALKTGEIFCWN